MTGYNACIEDVCASKNLLNLDIGRFGCDKKAKASCEEPLSYNRKIYGSYNLCMTAVGCINHIDPNYTDAEPLQNLIWGLGCNADKIATCEDPNSFNRAVWGNYGMCMMGVGCGEEIDIYFTDCDPYFGC